MMIDMKMTLTIMFFTALNLTIYFISRLWLYAHYKINPTIFKRGFTKEDILYSNVAMVIAIVLWSIIFYCKL
jgi:hypothetical protein